MAEGSTRPAIPGRHGSDLKEGRRMAGPLRWLIRGDPEPGTAEWRAVGESLNQGDPAMDRLVDWMAAEGLARTKPLFDRAVDEGIAAIPDAPAPLHRFFAEVEARPAWVDPRLLDDGARACGISGLAGMHVLRDFGLMAGYQAGAINRTLVLTGALQKGAQRRVAETTKWWIDATRPGGMARGAPGWRSTLQVRLIHAMVRRHLQRHPEWDTAQLGLPVNQGDMHATYLAFSVIFLLGQRLLGVPLSAREGRAAMHLWKYIGWLMGLDERWLGDSEQAGRVALYHNLLAQAPPDESSRQLGRPLADEPLQRRYRNLGWLRGRWNRAKHLSIARAFIGRRGMDALGLPQGVLPWYPLLSFGPRLGWHLAHRLVPGGRERLVRRGLKAQEDYLEVLFGEDERGLAEPMAGH